MDCGAEVGSEFGEVGEVDVAIEGEVAFNPVFVDATKVGSEFSEVAEIDITIEVGVAFKVGLCGECSDAPDVIPLDIEEETFGCVVPCDGIEVACACGVSDEIIGFAWKNEFAIKEFDVECASERNVTGCDDGG